MKKYTMLLALGFAAVLAIHPALAQAGDMGSDVFADEGDTDFDSIPTDVSKVPAAPAMNVPAAVKPLEEAPAAQQEQKPAEMEQAAPRYHEPHNHNVKKEEPATAPVAEEPTAERAATAVAGDVTPHAKHNGFRVTGKDCPMYRAPASEGEPMLTVKSEKRIWTESQGEWVKAYSKSGPGYISADCLK